MKKVVVCLVFVLVFVTKRVKAQSLEEWTQQKETQVKYLIEQLVALRGYGKVVMEGYELARNGLTLIHAIKEGDFHLHHNYFNSLRTASLGVGNYNLVKEIIRLEKSIEEQCTSVLNLVSINSNFIEESIYLGQIVRNLQREVVVMNTELEKVLTSGQYVMKDDARMDHVKKLYKAILDRYLFIRYLSAETKKLFVSRIKERKDLAVMHKLQEVE